MHRRVEPEILDHLPADDPAAIRSRQDLRRINFLMGNERWLARSVGRFREEALASGITELGAGEGRVATRLLSRVKGARVECLDLAPRPVDLDSRIDWHQQDVLEMPPQNSGVLVAGLFLHHFEEEGLQILGQWCDRFRAFCFAEPLRSPLAIAQGALLLPFVNHVTRHDMMVSIRAGFAAGELPEMMGLRRRDWHIQEQCTWRGGLRVLGWRV